MYVLCLLSVEKHETDMIQNSTNDALQAVSIA